MRKEMDTIVGTGHTETAEGLLVRLAALYQTIHAYVRARLSQEVHTLGITPAHAGHPEVTTMYTSMRRAYFWAAMIAEVHAFVAGCATCAKCMVYGRRRDAPLNFFPAQEPF